MAKHWSDADGPVLNGGCAIGIVMVTLTMAVAVSVRLWKFIVGVD